MGASQPSHIVEVRVQQPTMATMNNGMKMSLFACIHSACDGPAEYSQWGEPHLLGLWSDDIITVSLYLAKSEKHFASMLREELAETYLPWIVIREFLKDGEEVVFCLGLSRGAGWLGYNATREQYMMAFHAANMLGSQNPQGPCVLVGVREVQHVVPTVPSTARSHSARSPGGRYRSQSSERRFSHSPPAPPPALLAGLQPSVASPGSPGGPASSTRSAVAAEPETEAQALLRKRLSDARFENERLRTEAESLDRELAATTVMLAPQFGEAGDGSFDALPPYSGSQAPEAAQLYEELQAEVRRVNLHNMQLIHHFDEQIRLYEAEVAEARLQVEQEAAEHTPESVLQQLDDQLQMIHGENEKLQAAISQELNKKQDAQRRIIQQTTLEHEVQLEEIQRLRALKDELQNGQLPLQPPSTAVLQDEVSQLRVQIEQVELARAKEAIAMQQYKEELLQETQQLQAEAAKITTETKALEATVQNIRSSVGSTAASSVEREQLRQRGEALAKEIARAKQRLAIDDERIQHLRDEASNIRQRAEFVSSSRDLRSTMKSQGAIEDLNRRIEQLHRQVNLANQLEKELVWEQTSLRDEIERLQVSKRVS